MDDVQAVVPITGVAMTRSRRVVAFFGPHVGDMPQSERAKKFDALSAQYPNMVPGRPSPGATAEQTLAGLISWVQQWVGAPANDDARILLMYDTGYRDERAGMFNAVCDPEAFAQMLMMAAPPEWRKDS